jgi:hypothetical protein
MEKNIIYWVMGIVILAAVFFNLGDFTGNVAKDVEPTLIVTNTNVRAGYDLQITAKNIATSQELKVFQESGKYTGKRFFTRASRCDRMGSGIYTCSLEYTTPTSMAPGRYYVQAKDKRTGEMEGNQALFNII